MIKHKEIVLDESETKLNENKEKSDSSLKNIKSEKKIKRKKIIKLNWKHDHKKIWFDSMIGMTWGFIASLIVGTVIGLFGMYSQSNIFVSVKHAMSFATPAAIGVGIAYKAKLSPLQIISIAIGVFLIGHSSIIPKCEGNDFSWAVHGTGGESTSALGMHFNFGLPGDVFGAWIGSIMFVYLFYTFKWQTFIDLYLIPIIAVFMGLACSYFLTYLTSAVLVIIEWVINNTVMKSWGLAILLAPVIGILMGLALSLPTSSAAIAFALSLKGNAATAAIAGTAAQMISFGVLTYLSTGSISKSLAVGFGTSMLQMNNFIKKPKILLIPAFVSGISAMIAVLAFKDLPFPERSVTSGMGSAMLYGQIFTLKENGWGNWIAYMNVIFIQLLIPALLGLGLGKLALKKNFLKKEWMEISYA